MCLPCFGISLLTLLTPGSAPTELAPTNVTPVEYNQINPSEATTTIKKLLDKLPNSPELKVLRSDLESLQTRLVKVKNNAEATKIFTTGVQAIEERIKNDPNANQIVEALLDVLEGSDSEQAFKNLGLKEMISFSSDRLLLQGRNHRNGWLL